MNLAAVLKEPEPIAVFVPHREEISPGRFRTEDVLVELGGVYEIHDQFGTYVITGDGARREVQPTLFGSVDSRLESGRVIQVLGHGPHGGKQYRLGNVTNLRTHIESALEDV